MERGSARLPGAEGMQLKGRRGEVVEEIFLHHSPVELHAHNLQTESGSEPRDREGETRTEELGPGCSQVVFHG